MTLPSPLALPSLSMSVTPKLISLNPPVHLCPRLILPTRSLPGSLASASLSDLFSFRSPFRHRTFTCSLNLSMYPYRMVFAPTVPSAWRIVPPVFSWLPHSAFRAPPPADLPRPHRLDQPFLQHPTSCPLCPYPPFLTFLAIALILPEMTSHPYLYTCLSIVHSPHVSNPQRQTHCHVHCCSTSA